MAKLLRSHMFQNQNGKRIRNNEHKKGPDKNSKLHQYLML